MRRPSACGHAGKPVRKRLLDVRRGGRHQRREWRVSLRPSLRRRGRPARVDERRLDAARGLLERQRPDRGDDVQLEAAVDLADRRLVERQHAGAAGEVQPELGGGDHRHHLAVEVVALAGLGGGQGPGAGGADGRLAALAAREGVGERRLGRVEVGQQLDRGLGAEARDARQVVGGVAAQRGQVGVLLGTDAGDHREPGRVEQRRGVDAAVEDPQHLGVLVDQREAVAVGRRHDGARAHRRRLRGHAGEHVVRLEARAARRPRRRGAAAPGRRGRAGTGASRAWDVRWAL